MARFPVFGVLLLIVGVVWLLSGLGWFVMNLPWLPIILIVIAAEIIWNRFYGKREKRRPK